MSISIFDLDNTLLDGDSDYLWGRFLCEKGIVDADYYEKENQRFYDEYKLGKLDIYEFLRFSLKPLSEHPRQELDALRDEFMQTNIDAIILPRAIELVELHRSKNQTLMIITATNRFVTELIARRFGIDILLATEPAEDADGNFTGEVTGTPCFQDGKVMRLNEWLRENDRNLENSWFYSDSHNDIPLLEKVSHPVAVDADDILTAHAEQRCWEIISLR